MVSVWQVVQFFSLVAAVSVNADMKLDCGPDFLSLVWTESSSHVDLPLLQLGSCPPTSISEREAFFIVDFSDCNFRRLVTGDQIVYSNDLTSAAPPGAKMAFAFTHPVTCSYERPVGWYPPVYDPVFLTYGDGVLVFHMELTNDDFSGPAPSTAFALGSMIPIRAFVEQKSHQPLLLFLDLCLASTTPELRPESDVYPIISNHGCLVDSKAARSKFEPRRTASEIRLSLQAFRFALGEEVYIHCALLAWDPTALDNQKKACHYVYGHGWELLDDPLYNHLCGCCETSCKSRKTRSISSGGITHNAVLGPFTVMDLDAQVPAL